MKAGRSLSIGLFWMGAFVPIPVATAPARPVGESTGGSLAGLPWAAWFEKNTIVSDKKTYVHFFWDANAVRSRFEGKEKTAMIAEAGRQLALLRYPANATSDEIRADIVFVTQRDGYGNPRWDSVQRVAHLEFSRKRLLDPAPREQEPSRRFEKFEIFH